MRPSGRVGLLAEYKEVLAGLGDLLAEGDATHYDLLKVAPDASPAEIKRAYHDLASRYHPDARPYADQAGAEPARRIMAAVNAAWAVLGDPPRRRAYDTQIGVHVQERGPGRWAPLEPEPDDEDPMLEDDEAPPPGPADLVVFVPVGLLVALAVATFALSVLSQSPMWI